MIYIAAFVLVSLCGNIESRPEMAASITLSPTLVSKITTYTLECLVKTGANPSKLINMDAIPNDRASKNFFLCALTKAGLAYSNGTLNVELIISETSEPEKNELRKLLQKCNKWNGSDPAERLYNIVKCTEDAHMSLFA